MKVVVELFGPARLHAGTPEMTVDATTLGEALRGLESACPGLAGAVLEDGQLSRHYRISLNGRHFVSDMNLSLSRRDRLLLLTAEAGG